MIINGYIKPLYFEHERGYGLYRLGILCKDFKGYVMNVTDSIKSRIEGSANELGRDIIYLNSTKEKKEDIARSVQGREAIDEGLICVIKTLESCRTAKVFGSDEGKLVVKTTNTKCLHYYLYYQDRVFGFMFVKIQTWFPFNIQVYINGRELMKSVLRKNGITFERHDNSRSSGPSTTRTGRNPSNGSRWGSPYPTFTGTPRSRCRQTRGSWMPWRT